MGLLYCCDCNKEVDESNIRYIKTSEGLKAICTLCVSNMSDEERSFYIEKSSVGWCEECGAEFPMERLKQVKISASYVKSICDSCHYGVPVANKIEKDKQLQIPGLMWTECDNCDYPFEMNELTSVSDGKEGKKLLCSQCLSWERHNNGEFEQQVEEYERSPHYRENAQNHSPVNPSGKQDDGKRTGFSTLQELARSFE